MKITKNVLLSCKREFIIKFIVSLVLRGCLMVLPILYSFAVNDISTNNYHMAYFMIIASIVITIVYRMSEHYNQKTYYTLYNKLYRKYTNIALSYTYRNSIYSLSRINLGEYTNIFNNDIDVISTFWATSVVRIVQLMEFIFIYIYFFRINIYIGLVTIVISLIVFLILLKYGSRIESLNKERKDTLDKKTGILQEIFLGIKEIKGLNLISSINKRVRTSTNEYLDTNTKYNVDYNKNKMISLFFIELFRLILFLYGIYLISKGNMEIGVLLIIYNYYSKLIDNLNEVGTINMEHRNLITSWVRFNKLIEYSRSSDKTIKELNDNVTGRIVFDKVVYGNRTRPSLKKISFAIEAKSITILTGRAGSDKNGIFDLLLRLNRQHHGSVKIDDIDIETYNDNVYYSLVSSAREQPSFFSISIKDNLEIIEPDFVKVVGVCKSLKIHDYIMNLKDGYDTILTPSADNINVAIKNLLSIARILLKDPKIMLFYDTMTFLDQEALENIFKILREKKNDHTIVLISRSKEMLKLADKIIVVEDGNVKDEGTLQILAGHKTIQTIMNK